MNEVLLEFVYLRISTLLLYLLIERIGCCKQLLLIVVLLTIGNEFVLQVVGIISRLVCISTSLASLSVANLGSRPTIWCRNFGFLLLRSHDRLGHLLHECLHHYLFVLLTHELSCFPNGCGCNCGLIFIGCCGVEFDIRLLRQLLLLCCWVVHQSILHHKHSAAFSLWPRLFRRANIYKSLWKK